MSKKKEFLAQTWAAEKVFLFYACLKQDGEETRDGTYGGGMWDGSKIGDPLEDVGGPPPHFGPGGGRGGWNGAGGDGP